ncbi:hypothetical protein NDU88_000586 [Pleurodeles waltl]|uniref:Uncharacterized protein n=1 Tax=Pleurodeles waltl TaxID=8319 RepID=A0AAV7L914_PLEWA|nr:hypothetical protein NDU88_000586 [Pleurodeles waltl]
MQAASRALGFWGMEPRNNMQLNCPPTVRATSYAYKRLLLGTASWALGFWGMESPNNVQPYCPPALRAASCAYTRSMLEPCL